MQGAFIFIPIFTAVHIHLNRTGTEVLRWAVSYCNIGYMRDIFRSGP